MRNIFIFFYFIYLIFLLVEKIRLKTYRNSFLYVIHVNGIRGKTSVCRLLDASLRQKYRVFTKTTGTDPRIIGVDNVDRPLKRLGGPNIREQIKAIRLAKKQNAEILILECMAVNPLLQKASEKLIVQSDIGVITNARYDHIFEMGHTLEEITKSLCSTIPNNGKLFTTISEHINIIEEECDKNNTKVFISGEDNTDIARSISRELGLTDKQINLGLQSTQKDFGASQRYHIGKGITFINLFSVNDPTSTLLHLQDVETDKIYFIYNSRTDRPDRLLLFVKYFFPKYDNVNVFIIGNAKTLTNRILKKHTKVNLIKIKSWRDCFNVPQNSILVGIGNIKGDGYEIIEDLERGQL